MKNFIKKNAILFGGVLILIIVVFEKIQGVFRDKGIKPKSKDKVVGNAINIIEVAIGSFGTFNKDHLPIFEVLESLTKKQIELLHADFGLRFYNRLTGQYSFVQLLEGLGVARPLSLTAVFLVELDELQIYELKRIYLNKGLSFPNL